MNRYRIYTENKNYRSVMDKAKECFEGFTVFTGTGVWHGTEEKCLVIEVLSDGDVDGFVYWLKKHNGQDCIAVTCEQVQTEFVKVVA